MGVSNGKVTAPVSLYDVMTALGESKEDVGTLCMSSKINKWAKFKPYNIDQPADITDAQRKAVNFGLTFPAVYNSKSTLIAGLKGNTTWNYERPSETCMKRITDFDGYDHNAVAPFGTVNAQQALISSGPKIVTTLPVSGTDKINIGDFQKTGLELSQWYFSILLFNDTNQWLASAANTFAQGDAWVVSFSGAIGLVKGLYNAIPFASSKRWVPGQADPTGFKACGIGAEAVAVRIITEQDMYTVYISAKWNSAKTSVSYTITIHNGAASAHSFPNVSLYAATSNAGAGSLFLKNIGNVAVAAGDTLRYSGISALTSTYSHLGIRYDGVGTVTWFGINETISGGGGDTPSLKP